MRNLLREEKGSVLIILVIGLTVFIGFVALVIDGGMIYATRSKLQNAVDAAALAGVQGLFTDSATARDIANTYANKNGIDTVADNLSITTSPTTAGGRDTEIKVSATKRVYYTFAKILSSGMGWTDVHAEATARIGALTSAYGVQPIGLERPAQGFSQYEHLNLLDSPGGGTTGWYGWLYLGGIKPQDTITGYQGWLKVGALEEMKNGYVAVAVKEMQARIKDDHCTYDHYVEPCPRLITVPIIGPYVKNAPAQVLGFARVFLDDVSTGITGTYMMQLAPGEIDPNAPIIGLYGVKLTK
jgi:Flp pilus assembly protein TadG